MEKRYMVIISFAFLFVLAALLVYASHCGTTFPVEGHNNWACSLRAWADADHDLSTGEHDALSIDDGEIADGITVSKLADTAGITDILAGTQTFPNAIAAGASISVVVTMTGLDTTNDVVFCKVFNDEAENFYIISTEVEVDQARVRIFNPTGGALGGVDDGVACIAFKRP